MGLLVNTEEGWVQAEPIRYLAESEFQALVQETFDPTLVSQDDRPVVVAREVSTSTGGRIDVVAVDQDGVITLCECKLDRNPGSRREVLGQVIEYAASLNGIRFEEFRRMLEVRLGTDPVEAMRDHASDDFDAVRWGEAVSEALAEGRFRLIIAVDQLTDALKQTVIYLNERASFSLVVAELRRIKKDGVDVLASTLFGEEAAQRKLPRRPTATTTVTDADAVVVAARLAYPEFKELGAYICQPKRSFRPGTDYLGFYAERTIYPEFPRIVVRREDLVFSREKAETLLRGDEVERQLGTVMSRALESSLREEGNRHQIVLLSPEQGFRLERPIVHEGPGAWTQGQRYATSKALRGDPATTDDLAAAEG
jgi:hypothetical protein